MSTQPDTLHDRITDALLQNLRDTVGGCTCDEAYTGRGLVDPHCGWHEALGTTDAESVARVAAVLAETAPAQADEARAWKDAWREYVGPNTMSDLAVRTHAHRAGFAAGFRRSRPEATQPLSGDDDPATVARRHYPDGPRDTATRSRTTARMRQAFIAGWNARPEATHTVTAPTDAMMDAAREASAEITPAPGWSLNEWLDRYGDEAYRAGIIAAARGVTVAEVRPEVTRTVAAVLREHSLHPWDGEGAWSCGCTPLMETVPYPTRDAAREHLAEQIAAALGVTVPDTLTGS